MPILKDFRRCHNYSIDSEIDHESFFPTNVENEFIEKENFDQILKQILVDFKKIIRVYRRYNIEVTCTSLAVGIDAECMIYFN